ncbi:sigma 54-interacting transcriptional regulator [Leptothrix sp. BB-4]
MNDVSMFERWPVQQDEPGAIDQWIGHAASTVLVRQAMHQLLAAERDLHRQGGHLPPPLLLVGETGTGKKTVARALHLDGPRRMRPWRVLRCAGLSREAFEQACQPAPDANVLIDDEDDDDPVGLHPGSTLLLDEVAELSHEVQALLVRQLNAWAEAGTAGVRVISTTRHALQDLVQDGEFRADLAFQLGVFRIELPSLRQRLDDLEALATHFVADISRRLSRRPPALARSAVRRLQAHGWPGNVRELRNAVEAALLLNREPMLTGTLFNLVDLEPVRIDYVRRTAMPWAGGEPSLGIGALQPGDRADAERAALLDALARCNWNVTRTAQALDMSRDALRYRMQKHGLQRQVGYASAEDGARRLSVSTLA